MLAVQADGATVTTIEGLEQDGKLHPLQEAFRDSHSFQCGFCTPGFMMTALALLEEGEELDETELREELSGNLCRCTGYQSIVEGVQLAMAQRRPRRPPKGSTRAPLSRRPVHEVRRGQGPAGRGPAHPDRAGPLRR